MANNSNDTQVSFPKRVVITGGMPYGNKHLHFGHVGGMFIEADFFARFYRDRIGEENVIFVSGTDCYGSPIMEGYRGRKEAGYTGSIEDYVEENHRSQAQTLKDYGISLDLFSGSGLEPAKPFHAKLSREVIERLYQRGYLMKCSTKQFYDTKAHQFLNGRQVVGRCPVKGCKSEKAYADECDLGHQFDPEELITPVSQLTGTTPELRPVENWYFNLPAFADDLKKLVDKWDSDPQIRPLVTKTVRESLEPPRIYIQEHYQKTFDAIKDKLPPFKYFAPEGNQKSFSIVFNSWQERDDARTILEDADVRFRTGKTLLPFRLTGNISWGVPAPDLEDLKGLTLWCWPESLWAPISFTQTLLATAGTGCYSSTDWHDWWCSKDTKVFQFMGQDNINFYCVTQPALWEALDWGLIQDTPIANYHILFMNKKASSSGKIKPPMADDLLNHYTAEQLRTHWLSLALDQKAVSFSPKPYDTSVSHTDKKTGEQILTKDDPRVADPVLKESAFLTNIFNRLARSCFYGATRALDNHLPSVDPEPEVVKRCNKVTEDFEKACYHFNSTKALTIAEDFCREANKRWTKESKTAKEDPKGYEQALSNAFRALRTVTLLMHPVVPKGCEAIAEHLNIPTEIFFSWKHAEEGLPELVQHAGENAEQHEITPLPPRFDFFERHESQR